MMDANGDDRAFPAAVLLSRPNQKQWRGKEVANQPGTKYGTNSVDPGFQGALGIDHQRVVVAWEWYGMPEMDIGYRTPQKATRECLQVKHLLRREGAVAIAVLLRRERMIQQNRKMLRCWPRKMPRLPS